MRGCLASTKFSSLTRPLHHQWDLSEDPDNEAEVEQTQKNKATKYHLGLFKVRLAENEENSKGGHGGRLGEGFDRVTIGISQIGFLGFHLLGSQLC